MHYHLATRSVAIALTGRLRQDKENVSNVVMTLHYPGWCHRTIGLSASAIMASVMITGHVVSCHLDRLTCEVSTQNTNHQAAGNISGQYGNTVSPSICFNLSSMSVLSTVYCGGYWGSILCVSWSLIAKSDLIWVCRKVVCLQQVSSVRECHIISYPN